MKADVDDLARFHLVGHRVETELPAATQLLPALLAPYRDLPALRYDYPLVLSDESPFVEPLADVTNRALQESAPRGRDGERLRQNVLRIEAEIRRRMADGRRGSLGELWDAVALRPQADGDGGDMPTLSLLGAASAAAGRLVDCDRDVAAEVVTHLWAATERATACATRRRIDELTLGLAGILRAHDARSDEGREPQHLRASLGGADRAAFDFDAWSEIMRSAATPPTISDGRRRRIRSALEVLRTQRFVPADDDDVDRAGAYPFLFRSCVAAAAAYRERMPAMVQLVKALAIAELELRNGYRESESDAYFDSFDESSLTADDLDGFPSYLVCLTDADLTADELAQVTRILGSDAPINVVVEVRDVLGEPGRRRPPNGRSPDAIIGRQLGRMAMGAGTAFVVQTATSHIPRMIDRIHAGVTAARPALFSVFTGSTDHVPGLAPYLVASAAVQSRAVPTFVFDPDAGSAWADRFELHPNPDVENGWPAGTVRFEDAEMQRHTEPAAFSIVDFAALDRRYARHFATAPPQTWHAGMQPADHLVDAALDTAELGRQVPYVMMATADGVVHRVVVDRELIRIAREYGETWRSLQELAGINNSHAIALVAAERTRWEQQVADREATRPVEAAPPATVPVDPGPAKAAAETAVPDTPVPAAPAPDEPYIETVRCTTCDECTDINPRMFAYDDNKQAYIADLSAGTYREMVEAAEACQVAIIHPGLPWDRAEHGLDDLIARAGALA